MDLQFRVMRDGEPFERSDRVFVILEGQAIRSLVLDGRIRAVERVGAGRVVGMDAVLGEARSIEWVVAQGPVSALCMRAADAAKLLARAPALAYAVAAEYYRRTR